MAAQGCKYILAVDVTTLDERDLTNYGDHLSGWWLLWNKVNIFAAPIKIPTQADIQLRLAFWYAWVQSSNVRKSLLALPAPASDHTQLPGVLQYP